jgi:hypothetical protein
MDFRNSCSKFLSAECPNNCHYTDDGKHYESDYNRYFMKETERSFQIENQTIARSDQ